MIILLIIVVIIIILYYYWYYGSDNIIPTLHAKCDQVGCGGNLVCDSTCDRCRQILNSPCANDIDCIDGLRCIDWICSNNSIDKVDELSNLDQLPTKPPVIKWADEY